MVEFLRSFLILPGFLDWACADSTLGEPLFFYSFIQFLETGEAIPAVAHDQADLGNIA